MGRSDAGRMGRPSKTHEQLEASPRNRDLYLKLSTSNLVLQTQYIKLSTSNLVLQTQYFKLSTLNLVPQTQYFKLSTSNLFTQTLSTFTTCELGVYFYLPLSNIKRFSDLRLQEVLHDVTLISLQYIGTGKVLVRVVVVVVVVYVSNLNLLPRWPINMPTHPRQLLARMNHNLVCAVICVGQRVYICMYVRKFGYMYVPNFLYMQARDCKLFSVEFGIVFRRLVALHVRALAT